MRVAIEKVSAQTSEEMLLDVSRSISSRYKKRNEQNGTSLNVYVNSSLCKHFEIAPSGLLKVFDWYVLYILLSKSLNVYSFFFINFIY